MTSPVPYASYPEPAYHQPKTEIRARRPLADHERIARAVENVDEPHLRRAIKDAVVGLAGGAADPKVGSESYCHRVTDARVNFGRDQVAKVSGTFVGGHLGRDADVGWDAAIILKDEIAPRIGRAGIFGVDGVGERLLLHEGKDAGHPTEIGIRGRRLKTR